MEKQYTIEDYEKRVEEKNQIIEQLKKSLIAKDRLSLLGESIENIAHQWKQPLSSMSATLTGLQVARGIEPLSDEEFNEATNNILFNIEYLSETIDCFQNFFKENQSETIFDIQNVIEKILLILKGNFKTKQIQVVINSQKDCLIQGYENEFMQAIINIINNASDALMETKLEEKKIEITISKDDRKNYIQIEDTAGGIPQEIISEIFNHYFTTKEEKGTGIGLYLTKKIIKKNFKGNIHVLNSKKGAIFLIEIPRVQRLGE